MGFKLTNTGLLRYITDLHNATQNQDFSGLEQGPLNKNADTKKLEAWLHQHYVDYQMKFDFRVAPKVSGNASDEIMVYEKGTDKVVLNLTLLLNTARISDLTLSDELIKHCAALLLDEMGDSEKIEVDNQWVARPLVVLKRVQEDKSLEGEIIQALLLASPSLIYALILYTEFPHVNMLIYGSEKFDCLGDQSSYRGVNNSKYPMLDTLVGCLASQALKRLQLSYSERVTEVLKKIATAARVSSAEEIKQCHLRACLRTGVISFREEEFVASYLARPSRVMRRDPTIGNRLDINKVSNLFMSSPGFVSTHAVSALHEPDRRNIAIASYPSFSMPLRGVSAHPYENEYLMPPYTDIAYQGGFFNWLTGTVVNTPARCAPINYLCGEALRYAFSHYLSKPYREAPAECFASGDRVVQRPNHGLAHTMRKVCYLGEVIRYFALYGVGYLRQYCQAVSETDYRLIQLALVFSVTGRENELSHADSAWSMKQTRCASATHFSQYAKRLEQFSVADIACVEQAMLMAGQTKFMGESKSSKRKIAIIHILNLSHKLDLPRCYNEALFYDHIMMYLSKNPDLLIVAPSDSQYLLGEALIAYARACISATHDVLKGDDFLTNYDDVFARLSLTPLECGAVLRQVPTPTLKEQVGFDWTEAIHEVAKKHPKMSTAIREKLPPFPACKSVDGAHFALQAVLNAACLYLRNKEWLTDSVYTLVSTHPTHALTITLAVHHARVHPLADRIIDSDIEALIAAYPSKADQIILAFLKLMEAGLTDSFPVMQKWTERLMDAVPVADHFIESWHTAEQLLRLANLALPAYLKRIQAEISRGAALADRLVAAQSLLLQRKQTSFVLKALSLLRPVAGEKVVPKNTELGLDLLLPANLDRELALHIAQYVLGREGVKQSPALETFLAQSPYDPIKLAEQLMNRIEAMIRKLADSQLNNERHIKLLKSNVLSMEGIVKALTALKKQDLLNKSFYGLLKDHPEGAIQVAAELAQLTPVQRKEAKGQSARFAAQLSTKLRPAPPMLFFASDNAVPREIDAIKRPQAAQKLLQY